MARLGRHIRFFIRKKLSEDPVWQQPVVIFSGDA
jgi:5'-3' exoribonuclease 1